MESTTSIEVIAKSTEEALRQKNVAFLAQYPTDDAQIDYYTELAMQVFEKFEIDGDFTTEGVRKNVATWFENKRPQMDLFRKHRYWDEKAKAIIFSQNDKRPINLDQAYSHLEDMLVYVKHKLCDLSFDKAAMGVYNTICDLIQISGEYSSVITDDFIRIFSSKVNVGQLPKALRRMLVVGTKITKFTHKCFSLWTKSDETVVDTTTLVDEHEDGDRSYKSFDKYYAKFADCMSELTIKKITMLSLNFCDFMTMSNGNSWSSCQFINSHNIFHESGTNSYSGCYKQGCLSYALDKPSFLLYTLPCSYEGDEYHLQQKINRMCCQYSDGIIVTGKCYPNNEDEYIKRYRQTIQLVISEIENTPNLWTFSRKMSKITAFTKTHEDAGHYEDYQYDEQKPTISFNKHFVFDIDKEILIGNQSYCLSCGEKLYNNDHSWLQCGRHKTRRVCSVCGRRVDNDDDIKRINGQMYCTDCCFYCEYHGEWEPFSAGCNLIDTVRFGEEKVCDDALDNYFCCPECGKYEKVYRGYRNADGTMSCKKCYYSQSRVKVGDNLYIVLKERYEEGEYVLMGDDNAIENCDYGSNHIMLTYFPNRIARVRCSELGTKRSLTVGKDRAEEHWSWSDNCIVGAITGVELDDSVLGMTLEELKNEY